MASIKHHILICCEIFTCICICIWPKKIKKNYRILAVQISSLNKRIDELEQLEKLEEEIEILKESFKGNKYRSYKKNHIIVLLTKIDVFRREIILTKY